MEATRFDGEPTVEVESGVHLTQLAVGDEMSVQHLRMEPGGRVPEHSHPHEQLGFVYQGEQTFELPEETVVVGPGDSYAIPGGEPHAALNGGDEDLLAIDVFSPPRPDPGWLEED